MRLAFAGFLAAVALSAPAAAQAGTVSFSSNTVTYEAAPATAADENVSLGIDGGVSYVSADVGVTSADCDVVDATRVDCPIPVAFVVRLLGFDDSLDTDSLSGASTVEAHGGAGGDELEGSANADLLFGDDGIDRLIGLGGNDRLEGGPGAEDYLDDGAGDDIVEGGPGDDYWTAGPGKDTFTGGDGSDRADYGARTAAVTITLDGQGDDGEAGEGDNVAADVENAFGGSGNDTIVGTADGNELRGGAGNDTIVAGASQDRVEGNEGDDTIDTRDDSYDSVDCGPGTDTVYGDPGDFTENCEFAPDADGDRWLPPEDCAPNDRSIHPGAGEVFGNAVDEDCKDGPGYLRVISPISYGLTPKRGPVRVRFKRLLISELRAGDVVEVRCKPKRKGCPFAKKTFRISGSTTRLNLAKALKKRYLRVGTQVEIRILRANEIGKVQRYKVTRVGALKSTGLCLAPAATAPAPCT
jgi:RTX calcium-binding nonapeptide repeat (4 copies)